MLNGGAVILTSNQQDVVALSTTKVEFVVITRAGHSAIHFRQLMQDVYQRQHGATTIYEDSEGAVKLAQNPMASNMTNHIDIKHHCIRERVDARIVAVASVGTGGMHDGTWSNEGATTADAQDDLHAMQYGSGAKWIIVCSYSLMPIM
jgi:cysteine synthase